jgi:signal transduction histidine kinase
MAKPPSQDLLSQIPSPSTRLWVGLAIILSAFLVFAAYTTHEIRSVENFQVNVVERNRKASLQLSRLQQDVYLLAISIRDMVLTGTKYMIPDWQGEFRRLQLDTEDALRQEERYAVATPLTADKNAQLRAALRDFWDTSDRIFTLAQHNEEEEARRRIQQDLEAKRAVISETVARLLNANEQAQADAAERVNDVFGSVRKNILVLIGVLLLLFLASGLYTVQANRKTFERLHHLAERLQAQSEELGTLSWKLIEVQEDTLRQVSRDLHDEFGQILTAIGAMLSRAEQKGLDRNSFFVQEVQKVKQIVADTLETVRDSSQVFRPAILDDFGLEQTLEWFVKQFCRQTGVKVHFEKDLAEGFFPREDAIHIYRILQESLNNVAKHAKAQQAWVRLTEKGGELRLEVRDDGRGFVTSTGAGRSPGDGVGLMGMRERAQHLNGTFQIQSVPGKGTIVTIRIPIDPTALRAATEKVG